jgi:hypothetical protein
MYLVHVLANKASAVAPESWRLTSLDLLCIHTTDDAEEAVDTPVLAPAVADVPVWNSILLAPPDNLL